MGNTWSFVILGGFFVVMMMLTILPQKKRQRQMKEMISALRVGNRIKTIGGFVGTIEDIIEADDTLVINIGTSKQAVLVTIARLGVYMNMDANPGGYQTSANGEDDKPSI